MKIQGKILIITGAGGGFGKALTHLFLKKGARVIAVDINSDFLFRLAQECTEYKSSLYTYTLDICDKNAVIDFRTKVLDEHSHVDGLINNAGIIQPFVTYELLEEQTIERILGVNLLGTLNLTKAFLPVLKSREEAWLLNVSSMGGFLSVPGQSIYCATKSAVKGFTESLFSELSRTGVKVSIVFPGAMHTDIKTNSGLNEKPVDAAQSKLKPLPTDQAALQLFKGMEKGQKRIFIGKDVKLMNKLCRLFPLFAIEMINKKMGARVIGR